MTPFKILYDAKTIGFGQRVSSPQPTYASFLYRSFQVSLDGGPGKTAQVNIYGCNDGRFPLLIGTFDLATGAAQFATEVLSDNTSYEIYVGEVVALSAGAQVSLIGCI